MVHYKSLNFERYIICKHENSLVVEDKFIREVACQLSLPESLLSVAKMKLTRTDFMVMIFL